MTDWPYGTPFKFGEHDPNWLSTLLQAHSERRLPWELNMRSEIIRCDACTKEHNAEYVLPKEWVTTEQTDRYDGENMTHHFCSKTCLVEWATKGEVSLVVSLENWPKSEIDHIYECVGSLSISLDLLDPRESFGGPAAIFSQMQILENVREDYKKLCTAINAVLRKEIHHGKED